MCNPEQNIIKLILATSHLDTHQLVHIAFLSTATTLRSA